jgi:hypothetical protein
MKLQQLRLPFVLLALSVAAGPVLGQGSTKCHPADDNSAGLIARLKDWVTTTDPERVDQRTNIFKIPVVDPKFIVLSTDEKICAKLVQAYAGVSGGYVPASIYVVKMGPKYYAVLDPTDPAGEFNTVMIFDSKLLRTGGWTG